jgi:MFS family permease
MPKTKTINEEKIRHKEKYSAGKVNVTGLISFLMGFTQAAIIYVMSSYFKMASGSENVGLFYFLAYLVFMVALFNFNKAVGIIGKSNAFYFSLLAKIAIIAVLMICPVSFWIIFPLMLYLVFSGLEWASLDVILETFSEDRKSGRIRGKHLTLLNAGFLFGPLLATRLISHFDFYGVFLFIFIVNSMILVISLFAFRNSNHRFEERISVIDLLKKVLMRKNILRIYYISFVLEFFFAMMVVYCPIYLRDLGFSWDKIGIIFTFMLVPFVLVQYPMGLLADRKTGEKEAIMISLVLMGISSAAIYFVSSGSLLVWSVVLFSTRIGAALIEVLRDSYFYKRIDAQDVDLIHFFRTAMPAGYVAATALATISIIFLPLKAVFILTGIVVISALLPAFFLIDNKCEMEMKRVKK